MNENIHEKYWKERNIFHFSVLKMNFLFFFLLQFETIKGNYNKAERKTKSLKEDISSDWKK